LTRTGIDVARKRDRPRTNDVARAFFETESCCGEVVTGADVVHITAQSPAAAPARTRTTNQECMMDELNGRMMACQILITGLIARVANDSPDPLRFLTDFRDEIKAVVKGVNIAGMENTERVRQSAQQTIDELFSLMKAPSSD
jgi:hypothetical protein